MSSYLEWKRRALIMGSGGWWMPQNFNPDNCIAAYQFKDAGSKSAAFEDKTGHGYNLSEKSGYGTVMYGTASNNAITSLIWNGSAVSAYGGEHTGLLISEGTKKLSEAGIKSLVIRYQFLQYASDINMISTGLYDKTQGGSNLSVLAELNSGTLSQNGVFINEVFGSRTGSGYGGIRYRIPTEGEIYDQTGCIGVTTFTVDSSDPNAQRFNNDDLFVWNGSAKTLVNAKQPINTPIYTVEPTIGGFISTSISHQNCAYTIIGAAFYKVLLNETQFRQIHERLETI